MIYLSCLFVVFLVIGYLGGFDDKILTLSHWHHYFDKQQFSTDEFYTSIEKALSERQINATMKRITHSERNILSADRIYLRIESGHDTFDICAAPYASGYFVSWWLIRRYGFLDKVLRLVPKLDGIFSAKTFYELDTQIAFKTCVHICIQDAIDTISTAKGIRGLTELERQPKDKSW